MFLPQSTRWPPSRFGHGLIVAHAGGYSRACLFIPSGCCFLDRFGHWTVAASWTLFPGACVGSCIFLQFRSFTASRFPRFLRGTSTGGTKTLMLRKQPHERIDCWVVHFGPTTEMKSPPSVFSPFFDLKVAKNSIMGWMSGLCGAVECLRYGCIVET